MTPANPLSADVWRPAVAGARRFDLERSAGITLTLLLHAGLLLLLVRVSVQPQIKPQLLQAATVIDMQLIPQAQVTPVAASQAQPPAPPRSKPKPRLTPPKPSALEPEQFQQVSTPPAAASMAVAMPPPQPASAGIVEQLPIDYLTRVMMTIGLNRRYPLKALANREKGTVVVHIHLSRDGSVLDVTIIRSSGSAALDAEALDVVWRIAKFQALSPEYARGAEDFAIDQPIRFSGY